MSEIATESTVYTAAEVAAMFRTTRRHITDTATKHGVGFNLGGSAGFRFTELDVAALREALKPTPMPARRRRRRASG